MEPGCNTAGSRRVIEVEEYGKPLLAQVAGTVTCTPEFRSGCRIGPNLLFRPL
jgi:hypothetical protein